MPGKISTPSVLGLGREPAADVGHRDDVVAVVRHQLRHRPVRDADLAALTEQVEAVLGDRRGDRCAALAPVGQERVEAARVKDGTGKDVGADLGALLQHDHGALGVELFQPDRGGQPGGAGADDDDVVLHGFALDGGIVWLGHGGKA